VSAFDVGRVCVKLRGREKGLECVVVDAIDRNYVVIAGPGIRRRRVNMHHLRPLDRSVSISSDATDEDVSAALGG